MQKMKINQKGFTLIELIVSLAVLMIVLAGILNLVAADLLTLKLSRHQALMKDVAESELNRLRSLDFTDTDLDEKVGLHSVERQTASGLKITVEWKVTHEESNNERITVKRIDLITYITAKPIKARTYTGRVYEYDFKNS
jgi:prepilin-type N-terminal cleavage/methylation domain-containing protein